VFYDAAALLRSSPAQLDGRQLHGDSRAQSRPKTTILVVEDDPELRGLYRTALALEGYAVTTAEDGIAALHQIEASAPSLVVLDLALPRLGGRDVGREMAAHVETAGIPIVVVTGDAGNLNPEDVACVLRKPIDLNDLLEAVRRCLRRAAVSAATSKSFSPHSTGSHRPRRRNR
jgi:two-component system response regulator MprA